MARINARKLKAGDKINWQGQTLKVIKVTLRYKKNNKTVETVRIDLEGFNIPLVLGKFTLIELA